MLFAGISAEVAISGLLAIITLLLLVLLVAVLRHKPSIGTLRAMGDANVTAFLFDGTMLLDATPKARQLIEDLSGGHPRLDDVAALLEPRFPGIQSELRAARPAHFVPGRDASGRVAQIERHGETLRLTLQGKQAEEGVADPLAVAAMRDELATLRHIGETAPQLIWKVDRDGAVTWANGAYLAVADRVRPPRPGLTGDWPPAALFPAPSEGPTNGSPETLRLQVNLPDEDEQKALWFDVTQHACAEETLCFAIPADAIVEAEAQGRLFVQTLTKTFAELSIGLAIFDRSRRLVMFNPALLDLTRLPVTFLSSRPVFSAVLDRLRDAGVLPEPKNYATWREEVTALETEAREGTYCETWTLATGEIYRVTGRPHPDGALAFLIEDISAEIMLTRSFRAELEMAHNVIDTMEEAVAIFSRAGQLVLSNPRYDSRWASDDQAIANATLTQEIAHWQSMAAPTPLWDKIIQSRADTAERSIHQDHIRLSNGQLLRCRIVPLSGGATLIGFAVAKSEGPFEVEGYDVTPDQHDAPIQDSATG